MCVRLCWLLVDIENKMVDTENQRRMAVNWFYDQFRVVATSVDRASDVITIQMPWDEMVHLAEDLHDQYQAQNLRSQHQDLRDEYQRYEALLYLIKSLTDPKLSV